MEIVNRTIALANFYGDGKHLYEDELGWWPSVKEEAKRETQAGDCLLSA